MAKNMVTMKDIAKEAGVSRVTVSYVLNNRETGIKITDRTRKRVRDIAERLGYCRNELAYSIVTGKTNVIGFIGLDTSAEYVARALNSSMKVALDNNFSIKLMSSENDPAEIVRYCVSQRLAGVVARIHDQKLLRFLRKSLSDKKIPLALIDCNFEGKSKILQIDADDVNGGNIATEHLIGLGHRKIAYLGGRKSFGYVQERYKGFLQAMKKNGLKVKRKFCLNADENIDVPVRKQILNLTEELIADRENSPTAIFCPSDIIAMLVLRVAHELGIKVPEELSVVGFGNLEMAELATPPLTTVKQPFEEMGKVVTEQLIKNIDSGSATGYSGGDKIILPVELIVRKSTGSYLPALEK